MNLSSCTTFEVCVSCKFCMLHFILPALKADDKEQESGTAVTLSCVISDITAAAAVVWSKTGAADLSPVSVTAYTVAQGTYNTNTQTSTLAIAVASNIVDTTFTCAVTPSGGTAGTITMESNVFSKYTIIQSRSINMDLI